MPLAISAPTGETSIKFGGESKSGLSEVWDGIVGIFGNPNPDVHDMSRKLADLMATNPLDIAAQNQFRGTLIRRSNRRIPSLFIRERRVLGFRPRTAAAPFGPSTRHRV